MIRNSAEWFHTSNFIVAEYTYLSKNNDWGEGLFIESHQVQKLGCHHLDKTCVHCLQ